MKTKDKILIIEDDEVDAEFVIRTLKQARRYDIQHRANLRSGLYALKKSSFDLILLDLGLPDASHEESLKQIQIHDNGAPIVIYTGENDIRLALEKLREGVQDYLVKGESTSNELRRCIAYAIERSRLLRVKDEFLSIVSHELRTPITSILGSIGLLLSGAVGELPPKAVNTLEIAKRNCERLIRLINDLLDLQKIQAGKMELDIQPVDVLAIVKEALEANRDYAANYSVSLKNITDVKDLLIVDGDRDRIGQVLTNLISNAVKYSPENSSVTVKAAIDESDRVRISITDRGDGIPIDFQKKIFGKFMQADSSITRKKGGTGLGLNICKSIVTMHGGAIGFSSEQGSGTTFFFTLPVHQTLFDKRAYV